MSNSKFVVIAPTFNAEKTCRQTLLSLASQSYTNWKLVVVDDMSTDDTARTILRTANALGISDKVTYIFNKEKKWEVANMLEGLKHCDDEDVVCRLDMDDYLTENDAFAILNTAYMHNITLDVIWTAHRWFDGDKLSNMNISNAMAKSADPYKHPWVASHFKSFRKRLLTNVNDENFRGADGNYFKRIGDQAFMLPALSNARDWLYIPMCMYAYRCSLEPETFQTDDAKFQASEAVFLRSRGYVK